MINFTFASDNTSGIEPESFKAIMGANHGASPSYGEDSWTAGASTAFKELFECDCEVFFVFNGTAANALALSAMCNSYHSIITCESAHVETDECGAPEFFSNGVKLLLASAPEGKIDLAAAEQLITKRQDIHYPKPKVLTITQSTELGTVYTPAQVADVTALARRYGLLVHMDGARLANAAAHLKVPLADITWKAGVDALCFGGIKNGLGFSEAVIFFREDLGEEFGYRCKQAGQLASKMRFMAAPWEIALRSGGWLKNAQHANEMAALLAHALVAMPGVKLMHPVESNAVFVSLSEEANRALAAAGWAYYRFIGGGARFVCSWKTTPEDVELLVASIRKVL